MGLRILPKDMKEAMGIVSAVLVQGDSRYYNYESEKLLAAFILKGAVFLEKRELPFIDESKNDLGNVIQRDAKFILKSLLLKEGFKEEEIYFERSFLGGRPDVLAESREESKLILGEAYSCGIYKILLFLEEANEIWIITGGQAPWDNFLPKWGVMEWFVFKKGVKWKELTKKWERITQEKLKTVKSPIDSLIINI